MSLHEIMVNGEAWGWEPRDGKTAVYDEEGNTVFELPVGSGEVMVRIAIKAFRQGYNTGKTVGSALKTYEIRRALEITEVPA